VTLGTVKEYPTETSALKAAQVLRVTISAEQSQSSQQPVSVLALINHFKEHELGPIEDGEEEEGQAYSTRSTYIDILDFHVAKKWGKYRLADVRTIAVKKRSPASRYRLIPR
jgi:integrase